MEINNREGVIKNVKVEAKLAIDGVPIDFHLAYNLLLYPGRTPVTLKQRNYKTLLHYSKLPGLRPGIEKIPSPLANDRFRRSSRRKLRAPVN